MGAATASSNLTGLAQNVTTLVSGAVGWLLLLLLIIAGVKCAVSRSYGALAVDCAGVFAVGYFVFNPAGAQALMHSVAAAL
jgi:hypothetical protein